MKYYLFVLLTSTLLHSHPLQAEIHRWTDADGQLHFSDRPPPVKNPAPRKKSPQQELPDTAQQPDARPTATSTTPIKITIREMLARHQFDELVQTLHGYRKSAKENISSEEMLFAAFKAFDLSTPGYQQHFDAWVAAHPQNPLPYLGRAFHYYRQAWVARGTKWSSETKESQLDEMKVALGKCTSDLSKVFELDDKHIIAHTLLISVVGMSGDQEQLASTLQAALDVSPVSFVARKAYLQYASPRWGGSYDQMQLIIDSAQQYAEQNPQLTLLRGLVLAESGDMRALMKNYSAALSLYSQALEFGENHTILFDRGRIHYRREEYREALRDLNRAIELYPEASKYYYWRSFAHSKLNDLQRAVSDISTAERLAPGDPSVVKRKKSLAKKFTNLGYKQAKALKPGAAIENYNMALQMTPQNDYLYYRRARAYIEQNRLARAKGDLVRAIALNPDDYDYYKLLDWVLAKEKDWDQIIGYWDRYIELHPDNSRAYVERGGAYYHKGDLKEAVRNAKIAADMGNLEGKEAYGKFRHRVN